MNTESITTTPATSDTGTASASVYAGAPAEVTSAPGTTTTTTSTPSTTPTATTTVENVVTAPTYTPNFKYKAAMQEKEIDEFWRPLIKDADSEKKVKEIFTRADAFDYYKSKSELRDKEFDSLRGDFESQSKIVQKVTHAARSGDLDTCFRNIGLSDDAIIRWAAKKVDYLQMMQGLPPDQRMALEQQQQAQFQNQEYEEQLSQMQSQLQAQATQAREVQLDMSLLKPEVSQAVQFWDSKMGYAGAFRDMVVEEGQKAWFTEQKDLSAEQAIARVLQKFGKFIDAQGTVSQGQVPPPTQSLGGSQAPQAKPVIPVVNGTTKSPIKKQYRSLEDIKKRAKELEQDDAHSF